MQIPLLTDIGIIFGLSTLVILLFHKLRVPAIIGFLLTGALAGPHGLGLIHGLHDVEMLAEIGIVLLLFTIGIEFSLENLLRIKTSVLVGGSLQVLLTVAAGFGLSHYMGFPFGQALFIGFLLSLSSTAIVLNLLQGKAEVDTPHGRVILAILIFQDIIAIPMMLIAPFLSGTKAGSGEPLYILMIKIVFIIGLLILSAKYLIPRLLYQIVKTRISELFLLSLIGICIGVAWLTSSMGLSLALGAFIAGLIISESEYSHQALGYILPFKDIFTSFFFVSIGMLLNTGFFFGNVGTILLLTFIVMVIKYFIGSLSTGLLGYSLRTSTLVGIAICQVGEFAFVLSKVGIDYKLLDDRAYQLFLSVSILTMAATPFAIKFSDNFADFLMRLPIPSNLRFSLNPSEAQKSEYRKDHLIVIGFGLNGRHLCKVADKAHIPYLILETNPDTVRSEKKRGRPIYYGDATEATVLEHANIRTARVAVVAISDPTATRKTVAEIRRLCRNVYIIVRTRYLSEVNDLYNLGANEVISEEFETSIEIFSRVLTKYLTPKSEIEQFITNVREANYDMLRPIQENVGTTTLSELQLYFPDFEVSTFRLSKNSPVLGKTLLEVDLRRKYGVSLLALNRKGEVFANPDIATIFNPYDILVILGKTEDITKLEEILY